MESQLSSLRDLSQQFRLLPLLKQCEEIIGHFEINEKVLQSNNKVKLAYSSSGMQRCTVFPCELPIDRQKLKQFLLTGELSDVNIYIDGHVLVARAHKLILSLWSAPFMKVYRVFCYHFIVTTFAPFDELDTTYTVYTFWTEGFMGFCHVLMLTPQACMILMTQL